MNLKPSKLEASIYQVLAPKLSTNNISLTPKFPRDINKLQNREAIITMNALEDSLEGTIISMGILSPLISFTIFTNEYINCKKIQELLIDIMSDLTKHDFPMEGQWVQNFYKERRIPVVLDSKTELVIGGVDYRFTISNVI